MQSPSGGNTNKILGSQLKLIIGRGWGVWQQSRLFSSYIFTNAYINSFACKHIFFVFFIAKFVPVMKNWFLHDTTEVGISYQPLVALRSASKRPLLGSEEWTICSRLVNLNLSIGQSGTFSATYLFSSHGFFPNIFRHHFWPFLLLFFAFSWR